MRRIGLARFDSRAILRMKIHAELLVAYFVFLNLDQLIDLLQDERSSRAVLLGIPDDTCAFILVFSMLITGIDNDDSCRLHRTLCDFRVDKLFKPSLQDPELLNELYDIDLSLQLFSTLFEQAFISIRFNETA